MFAKTRCSRRPSFFVAFVVVRRDAVPLATATDPLLLVTLGQLLTLPPRSLKLSCQQVDNRKPSRVTIDLSEH